MIDRSVTSITWEQPREEERWKKEEGEGEGEGGRKRLITRAAQGERSRVQDAQRARAAVSARDVRKILPKTQSLNEITDRGSIMS